MSELSDLKSAVAALIVLNGKMLTTIRRLAAKDDIETPDLASSMTMTVGSIQDQELRGLWRATGINVALPPIPYPKPSD